MKKLFALILALLVASPTWAASQWYQGSGTAPLQGTTLISAIDSASKDYAFDPLDRLLTTYRSGQVITYASASSLTVTAGEVVVANAAGTTKLMLSNTADTTVTWADIDTGAEAGSSTYYVYAVGASDSATAVTYKISLSATTPTGVTYYKRLGSFYNNPDSNIATIANDNDKKKLGDWSSKSVGTTYQATTDGFYHALAYCGAGNKGFLTLYSDGASTPTTVRGYASCADYDTGNINPANSATIAVKAGDYYKATVTTFLGSVSASSYFIPIN